MRIDRIVLRQQPNFGFGFSSLGRRRCIFYILSQVSFLSIIFRAVLQPCARFQGPAHPQQEPPVHRQRRVQCFSPCSPPPSLLHFVSPFASTVYAWPRSRCGNETRRRFQPHLLVSSPLLLPLNPAQPISSRRRPWARCCSSGRCRPRSTGSSSRPRAASPPPTTGA